MAALLSMDPRMPPFQRTLAGAALLLLAGHATASSLVVNSAAGEPIGEGTNRTWASPTAVFSASGTTESVTVLVTRDGESFSLEFAAPHGKVLEPGSYYSAERADVRTGKAPGLDVLSGVASCPDVWGSFTIRQVAFDEFGVPTQLEATFSQRCGSNTAPLLSGTLAFNTPPWYFSYNSTAGDPVGNGIVRTLYPSTSDIALHGTANGLSYGASGLRDNVYLAISPPTGKTLAPGIYPIARAPGTTAAGIFLTNNLVSCNTVTGTLNIRALTFGEDGHPTGLYANLTLYCNGASAPFKATIRHKL
jgi:hypothetical protein